MRYSIVECFATSGKTRNCEGLITNELQVALNAPNSENDFRSSVDLKRESIYTGIHLIDLMVMTDLVALFFFSF